MVTIHNLTKSYQDLHVLEGVNLTLKDGRIYCLMAPSGGGKTTLLRILMGLESADSGEIRGLEGRRLAAVFQEDRLCEAYTALDNVMMTAAPGVTRDMAREELRRLLPDESVERPVCTLSGGMKRRTAVCRAVLAFSHILIMDEPFTGLDGDTRQEVIRYIREKTVGKLVVLSTHQKEDAEALGGELIGLSSHEHLFDIG